MSNKTKIVDTTTSSALIRFNCETCGVTGESYRRNKNKNTLPRFCSQKCVRPVGLRVTKAPETRECAYCKVAFMVLSNNKKKRYCTLACSNRHRNTGQTMHELRSKIAPTAVKEPVLNAVDHQKLKNAQFITDKNTEITYTVNKSDIYKIKCLTCENIIVRYLSRGKPVPRFCSKKCTRWLGEDRKHADTSSHLITEAVKTYAEADRDLARRLNVAALSFSLVSIGLALYMLLGPSILHAGDRICRSPKLYNISGIPLYDYAAHILGTDPETVNEIALRKVENHNHIETIVHNYDEKNFEHSRMILTFEMLRVQQKKLNATGYFDRM